MCTYLKHFVIVFAAISMLGMPILAQDIHEAVKTGNLEQLKDILEGKSFSG